MEGKVFKSAVDKRKNENKSKKQEEIRKKQQDEIEARRARATKRAQKVIIKGRKVPQEYPIHKEKKKKINVKKFNPKINNKEEED